MSTTDLSADIAKWANWAVVHKAWFIYLESRPFPLYIPTWRIPIRNDCSSTAVWCCWMAGAPEPFPGAYSGIGNTESFLTLEHVAVPRAGDFVVYGEGLSLSVQHMAVVVQAGPDPLTMSHGWSGEPAFVPVSRGCPPAAQGIVTFVRTNTVVPAPQPPAPVPTEDDLLLIVINPNNKGQAVLNLADGTWYGFDSPDMLSFYKDNGVKAATRQPTVAEFGHFTQRGTI